MKQLHSLPVRIVMSIVIFIIIVVIALALILRPEYNSIQDIKKEIENTKTKISEARTLDQKVRVDNKNLFTALASNVDAAKQKFFYELSTGSKFTPYMDIINAYNAQCESNDDKVLFPKEITKNGVSIDVSNEKLGIELFQENVPSYTARQVAVESVLIESGLSASGNISAELRAALKKLDIGWTSSLIIENEDEVIKVALKTLEEQYNTARFDPEKDLTYKQYFESVYGTEGGRAEKAYYFHVARESLAQEETELSCYTYTFNIETKSIVKFADFVNNYEKAAILYINSASVEDVKAPVSYNVELKCYVWAEYKIKDYDSLGVVNTPSE